ncbi:outer membrane receptor for ferrienterochelin and colicin [Bergeyella porcorum]|uniref:Outer membrane receptor for ferrienterochelin and colicin n=2 Tax=Bergeyella porcorum TaxID=1735111 RepID=A0AAU0EZE4_9FLAO
MRMNKNMIFSLILAANAISVNYFSASVKDSIGDSLQRKSDTIIKNQQIEEVVVSGTMKPVKRLETPVPVEVYSPAFFKKNPSPNIFEALQNVNGIRPQINCSVCNTGDIQINGLPGAYTMVMIDGMPMVSALGTVYGLSGIPNALVERVEIVKGPASSLYGSEAVAGLINIITKKTFAAPRLSADVFTTSWGEYNLDLGFKFPVGKTTNVLTGINYFNYQNPIDVNQDGFTDLTLQDRISVFQKWNFKRKDYRAFSLAGRYLYEDRWGGEMRWNKSYRGGNEVYGESIYTRRAEFFGQYQLPLKEKMMLNFSLINHHQDSWYGDTPYFANQNIGFGQLVWDKTIGKTDWIAGAALRYQYYDDNTPATATALGENQADKTWLPGIFAQTEWSATEKSKLLFGARVDVHNAHGTIFTPRVAYKYTFDEDAILRLNAGTGFRVVNLFTEDHAALTGGRTVILEEHLNPEKSYNANLNFIKKWYFDAGYLDLEATAFYTYFNNRILPDYETDARKIIYKNLNGNAISKGVGLNADLMLMNGWRFLLGATLMDNTVTENGNTTRQMLTERFSANWAITYQIPRWKLNIDYTGNLYSPMRLPLAGELDPRSPESPWWSLQNIQFTYTGFKKWEIYAGIKNLLNWVPYRSVPFLIARSHDPFDKNVQYDASGNVLATAENPYALTFDPSYSYAPNQGIRGFLGVRFRLN